jgi:hypothetical protein
VTIQKLDYLVSLGVTCLWLLAFYPSPLRDDGHDIADYERADPRFGSLDDFVRRLTGSPGRGSIPAPASPRNIVTRWRYFVARPITDQLRQRASSGFRLD